MPWYVIRGRKHHLRNVDEVLWFLEKTLEQRFTLSFADPNSDLNPKIKQTEGEADDELMTWEGITWLDYRQVGGYIVGDIKVNLSLGVSAYQPLLRNDLSASERFIAQFCCATTIMHELMVGVPSRTVPSMKNNTRRKADHTM